MAGFNSDMVLFFSWHLLAVRKTGSPPSQGTDHHADVVLLSSRAHLQRVIHHQVHEGVEPSQDALHVSASIQLH